MRYLTLEQMQTECGGVLPPDAVLIPTGGAATVAPPKKAARRPGRSARFAVLNTFTDFTLATLTGTEVKVWLILFRDTKADSGTARTGQSDLARRAGVNVRTVRRALAVLERGGLIVVRHRGRLNAGPSVYVVRPTGKQDQPDPNPDSAPPPSHRGKRGGTGREK